MENDHLRDEISKLRAALEEKRDYIVFLHDFYIDWATADELWDDFQRWQDEGEPEDFKPKHNF